MPNPSKTVLVQLARKAANKWGVDPDIFVRQIEQESGFRTDVVSPAGAQGIAQFMPDTARQFGIDPFDFTQALDAGAKYMAQSLKRYGGDYAKALASYNAGVGNVDKYGGVPPFEETQRYVRNILGESMPENETNPIKRFLAWRKKYLAEHPGFVKPAELLAKFAENEAVQLGTVSAGGSGKFNTEFLQSLRMSGRELPAGASWASRFAEGVRAKTGPSRAGLNIIDDLAPTAGKITKKAKGGITKGKLALGVLAGAGTGALAARQLTPDVPAGVDPLSGQEADLEQKALRILLDSDLSITKEVTPEQFGMLVEEIKQALRAGGTPADIAKLLPERTKSFRDLGDIKSEQSIRNTAGLIARIYGSISEEEAYSLLNEYDLDDVRTILKDLEGDPDPTLSSYDDETTGEKVLYNPKTGEEVRRVRAGFAGQDPNIATVTDKRTGTTYRIDTRTGQRVDLGQYDYGTLDPAEQTVTDKRTGETLRVNVNTGARTPLGRFEYPEIDPRETFDEGTRRFDATEGRLSRQQEQANAYNMGNLDVSRGNLDVNRGQLDVNRGQLGVQRQQQFLEEQKYIADVLRRPSDFIARAFGQRGQLSPQARVTQADLINNLKAGIQQFAEGGFTQEGKFITGDSKSGKPTGNEEMVVNPTNAPIMVIPNHELGSFEDMPHYAGGTGWTNVLGDLLASGQVNPAEGANLAGQLGRLYGGSQRRPVPVNNNPSMGQSYDINKPGSAWTFSGSDAVNWSDPSSISAWAAKGRFVPEQYRQPAPPPMPKPITQEELIATGRANLAPAASSALYGGEIPAARPVGQLTLGRLNRLTPGELEALNTQLGVEFNTDLQNEIALLKQRFGPVVNRARGRLQV